MDFLILYEHVVREYESIVLLKLELERRGYSVQIRQLLDVKRLRNFVNKPKVVVASCMYDNEAINSHVFNNVGKCQKVVNLHWEQMLSDTQEQEDWFNFNGNAKKCIQTCWGKQTRERLIAHGTKPDNCPVTGAVMMDFLREEFNGYFKSKAQICSEHQLDENRKLILYISSFGYASMTAQEVKELSAMAGVDFSGFANTNKSSFARTLEYFDKYLCEHDDCEIVYRRHPSEWSSEPLLALAQKHEHFHVIFEDSVKQWIVVADKILLWMSTAVAEVYFANKSCNILRPFPIEHEYDPVIYKNASTVQAYDEFCTALDNGDNAFPINPAIIEDYFSHSDKCAYLRMADLLEQVYKNPPRDTPFDAQLTPHFNLIKLFALWGVHIMSAIKLDPTPFWPFAGRIYGYIQKSKISKKEKKTIEEKIRQFIAAKT